MPRSVVALGSRFKLYRVHVCYLSLVLLSCTAQSRRSESKDSQTSEALPSGYNLSPAEIKSLSYQRDSHSLVLQLSYTGCQPTQHRLQIGEACAESFPMQCTARLLRRSDYVQNCEALQTEELVHALDPGFDTSYVKVSNKQGQSLSTLVDQKGTVPGQLKEGEGEGQAGLEASDARIAALSYEKEGHLLRVQLNYGGCAQVEHSLKISEICALSFPKQCSAELMRAPGLDATCKKLLQQDLTVNLDKDFDGAVLTVKNKSGASQQVLIDRTGAVQSAQPQLQ